MIVLLFPTMNPSSQVKVPYCHVIIVHLVDAFLEISVLAIGLDLANEIELSELCQNFTKI